MNEDPSLPRGPLALDATPTRRRSVGRSWVFLTGRMLLLPVWAAAFAWWSWPLYFFGYTLTGRRPPVTPTPARFAGAVRLALGPLPAPGLPAVDRATIVVAVVERALLGALGGLAWWLDELLYGRRLAAVKVEAPLFELSAARSGSTQLAHYLEDEPGLVAPSTLRLLFPYLWLWRLAGATLGRRLRRETIEALFEAPMSPSHLERHEADAFRTDSIDPLFYSFHLGDLYNALGPDAMVGFDPAVLRPESRPLWEDFVAYVDRVLRKTLLADGGGTRRGMIKGHFLAAADLCAARWPDAVFLTVVRDPVKRIQSVVNFHREQPGEVLSAVPWTWLVARDVPHEVRYGRLEQAWFTRPDGPRRVVVRFDDYVHDLPGTLARVYRGCLDRDPPAGLRLEHAPRKRTYTTDRSLAELGVDVDRLRATVAPYTRWSRGLD